MLLLQRGSTKLLLGQSQIKNRIRKKRFFVTQKAVSVNFFENSSTQKQSQQRITNIVRAIGALACVDSKQLNLRV